MKDGIVHALWFGHKHGAGGVHAQAIGWGIYELWVARDLGDGRLIEPPTNWFGPSIFPLPANQSLGNSFDKSLLGNFLPTYKL